MANYGRGRVGNRYHVSAYVTPKEMRALDEIRDSLMGESKQKVSYSDVVRDAINYRLKSMSQPEVE